MTTIKTNKKYKQTERQSENNNDYDKNKQKILTDRETIGKQ